MVDCTVMGLKVRESYAYLLGWDHDTDFLHGFGKLIGLNHPVVVKIEILECFEEDGLFTLHAG